jgi:ketosteroid isomerase-like protein
MLHLSVRGSLRLVAAVAAGALMLAPAAQAQSASPEVRAAVGKVLTNSAAAYSAGNFQGFMASYEVSPETTYISGDKVITGYDAVANTYRPRFQAAGAKDALGKLSLQLVNVRQLGPDHVLAIGRFKVEMADAKSAAGIFSLTFHKTAAGWRIAADHTS